MKAQVEAAQSNGPGLGPSINLHSVPRLDAVGGLKVLKTHCVESGGVGRDPCPAELFQVEVKVESALQQLALWGLGFLRGTFLLTLSPSPKDVAREQTDQGGAGIALRYTSGCATCEHVFKLALNQDLEVCLHEKLPRGPRG